MLERTGCRNSNANPLDALLQQLAEGDGRVRGWAVKLLGGDATSSGLTYGADEATEGRARGTERPGLPPAEEPRVTGHTNLRDVGYPPANGHVLPGVAPYAEDQRGDADERDYTQYDAPPRNGGKASSKVAFDLLDSATLAAQDFGRDWLVRKLLVRGQPGVVGGPKKALKTSLLVDLAISLGTGTPFLGSFATTPCRVALLSGESGEATIKETALRVCAAKGIDLRFADAFWCFRLPQFATPGHVASLCDTLQAAGVGVVIVDPLYLSLLAGAGAAGLSAANMYDIGPLLMTFAQSCLSAGVTPILAHHFKTRPNNFDEPQLDDLAFSGIGEFSRQWLLVGRREKFESGTGRHKLWMSAGGSAGHGGLWALDIDEGVIDEQFAGRRWEVQVTAGSAARRDASGDKKKAKGQEAAQRDRSDEAAVMAVVTRLCRSSPDGCGYTQARNATGLSTGRFGRAVNALAVAGALVEVEVVRAVGSGVKRSCRGLRPPPPDHRAPSGGPMDGPMVDQPSGGRP